MGTRRGGLMISVALYGLAMLVLGYLIAWTIHAPDAKRLKD